MDFLRQARDRAQDVVAQAQQQLQQQQQKHGTASSSQSSPPASASSSQQLISSNTQNTRPASSTTSGLPGLSALYTGSLPPLIRSGFASFDPRFESARQTHILSNALKALSIDHEATARETKAVATATFKWGADLSPNASNSSSFSSAGTTAPPRLDGSCDPALVDIADRMAYILSTIGDLEAQHVKRAESARKEFKDIARAEAELSSRREKRVKLHKELIALVPERAKPSSAKRIGDLEVQLKSLESEDKAAEEAFGKLRRQKFQSSYANYMDSFVQLGEKMACAARYGKLLTSLVPADEAPIFPAAALAGVKGWDGAQRTAQVRASIDPALRSLQIDYAPPTLDSTSNTITAPLASATAPADPTAAATKPVGSYADTHAADIAELEQAQQAAVHELANAPAAGTGTAHSSTDTEPVKDHLTAPPPLNRFDSGSSYGPPSSPPLHPAAGPGTGTGTTSMTSRLNMGPTPHLPPSPLTTAADTSATGSDATATTTNPPAVNPDAPDPTSPHAPPEDVTVAETGAAIFGTGGPKTGVLGVPRRKSAVPGSPSLPLSSGSGSGAGAGVGAQTPAPYGSPSAAAQAKSAEAAAERLAAEQADVEARAERERAARRVSSSAAAAAPLAGDGGEAAAGGGAGPVHARLRRDGTIVRRGEADWAKAENEDLPAYTPEDTAASGQPPA
ncbi:unnamed protein product [Tilletia controversa]|uniref:BAR domain-containing protein n=2 Tax=Tilletia TaxID=13289 RepID=A0A177UKY4_9BASI|nr:hypothetical protein CF336_g5228 [Tilletia laevis]KAE8258079.1 hypothetical protein A4X03_0g4483 [Tilletia caries]CAD6937467.1 unnamed protein product [Tilletia controversa]KAE8198603.1 hypothetical protein CF335_g4354 [Tilletia laevis]CAD6884678.1 unnamed protein product [Tilletia caries]